VAECAPWGTRLWLHYIGEPTLHPDLPRFVATAAATGRLSVGLSTNGIALTPPLARALIAAGLERLDLSLDAADRETYRRIRGRDRFDLVERNLHALLALRKAQGSHLPRIALQIVTLPENREAGARILERWREALSPTDFVKTITPATFAGQIDLPDGSKPAPSPPEGGASPGTSHCRWIHAHAVILWDGTMSVCPNDYEGIHAMGNVGEATIAALWNGPRFAAFRRLHATGGITPEMLCHRCPDYVGAEGGRFRYAGFHP
ncbi:MAG: radical SAM/SPASM domain-containing protein, partial [Deltaproteobacteria bacterium]